MRIGTRPFPYPYRRRYDYGERNGNILIPADFVLRANQRSLLPENRLEKSTLSHVTPRWGLRTNAFYQLEQGWWRLEVTPDNEVFFSFFVMI